MAFPGDYTLYQEVTIQSSQVDADLTDFPVYIDLSDLSKAGADIFDTCRSDGGDIRITKSDGTTELAREVVAIDTSAKTGEVHTKFTGSLSSSSNTTIRVWYNGTDTEPAVTATYGRNNVWTDYDGVFHLEEDPSGSAPQMVNSTGSNHGTSEGTMTSGDSVSGQIGNSLDFEGTDDAISVPDLGISGTQNHTMSAWYKTTETSANHHIMSFGDTSPGLKQTEMDTENATIALRFNGGNRVFTFTDANDGNWHLVYSVLDGTAVGDFDAYGDGAALSLASEGNPTGTIDNADNNYYIAHRSGGGNYFDGGIDEVRWRSDALSVDWHSTEYNNQSAPASFYTVGDEQGGSAVTFVPKIMIF